MNEKKKIFLYILVVGVLNLFFLFMMKEYVYMMFFLLSLIIGYYSLYPEEFFLILNNAKKHAQNYLRNYKTKHAVEDNHIIENQDIPEGYEEKRDFKKVDENNNKRNNISFVN